MELSPSWEANGFSTSQQIPTFYGTQEIITAFTSNHHLSLCWASSIQFASRRFIFILYFLLCLGLLSGLFLCFRFPHQTLYAVLPHMCLMSLPSHTPWFDHLVNIWWAVEIMKLLICSFFFHSPGTCYKANIFSHIRTFSNICSICYFLNVN